MRTIGLTVTVICFVLTVGNVHAQNESSSPNPETDSTIFENVVRRLEKQYYDEDFRKNQLPGIVQRYRPRAKEAKTVAEQRQVTFEFLSRIPASHLGLFSKPSYDRLIGELFNRMAPTLGLELIEIGDQYFAHNVLEGGAAARAGIRIGDRILRIDGKQVTDHPRLDFRTDDAYVPDPAVHSLLCKEKETVKFDIDRGWGKIASVDVEATPYSAFEAAKASIRVIEHEGRKIGYIHFWFIHVQGTNKLLKETLERQFKDCDAFVLDLRGRGGNAMAVRPMIDIVSGKKSSWKKPSVALVDNRSRSAKEVIAHLLQKEKVSRIVGQRTAGAVIPATFINVGDDTVLMFPTFKLGEFTDILEGHGVLPDVMVETWKPFAGKQDSILAAGLKESLRLIDVSRRSKSESKDSAANHSRRSR